MARRQTPIQKLVTFALSVTEEELNGAMETLKAIKDSRFPKQQQRQPSQRKPRKPRATRTPTDTPPASDAAAQSSSAN